ncbi:hypothetical protein D3C76_1249780 [compost metagenome]
MRKHLLYINYTKYTVFIAGLDDRITGIVIGVKYADDIFIRHIVIQGDHSGTRNHNILGYTLIEGKYIFQILQLLFINLAALKALGHNDPQLFFRIMLFMACRLYAEHTQDDP